MIADSGTSGVPTFLWLMLWRQTANLSGLWDGFSHVAPLGLLFLADLAVLAPDVLL